MSLTTAALAAANVRNPVFWEQSFMVNISNPTGVPTLVPSTSYMTSSQDFQGIYVDSNSRSSPNRVVFNFGESCPSSNTTIENITQMNFGSLNIRVLDSREKIALVKRGNCSWSEKIRTVNQLASSNSISISAVFIYDNETHGNTITVDRTPVTGSGTISPPSYPDPLPAERSVLNMSDNDLDPSSPSATVVYFIPAVYGNQFVDRINQMYNSSYPDMRRFWLLTPYLEEVSWGLSGDDGFFSTGRGYLSYIIALAAIFLIGIVIIRWWKIRRMRNEMANGYVGPNGFPMQARNNQLDPLPVDVVNSLPINVYSEGLVKNVNCAICLEDFVPGKNDIRILPCGHGFCVLCIDPWLTQKSTMCPICKWDCLPAELRREREEQNANNQNYAVVVDMGNPSSPSNHTVQPNEEPSSNVDDHVASTTSTNNNTSPTIPLTSAAPPSPSNMNSTIEKDSAMAAHKEQVLPETDANPTNDNNLASSSSVELPVEEKKDSTSKH
ncbi:hypothetical protein A0J61_03414 [Choanephora cucurbitarum]|uniref:RING-type domain-containing protein n=1 Tax=Choanephora cucurbitarum TaxID=101091 RepID=A0A1C7NHM1_9FUNG|nr:hypothetical protein A0J61_03414 [Choanephora cucurbitarum]